MRQTVTKARRRGFIVQRGGKVGIRRSLVAVPAVTATVSAVGWRDLSAALEAFPEIEVSRGKVRPVVDERQLNLPYEAVQ